MNLRLGALLIATILTACGGGNSGGSSISSNIEINAADNTSNLMATGITQCGDYAYNALNNTPSGHTHSNQEDCNNMVDSEGDPIPDGQDGHIQAGKPMSYSIITQNGSNCIEDHVTGLVWEQKTDDNGLRDKDHSYTWYNLDATSNGGNIGYQDRHDYDSTIAYGATCGNTLGKCNTQAYIQALNNANYCGYTDWRMPSVEELLSIVDYGKASLVINSLFGATLSSFYWSASPYVSPYVGDNYAWGVYFDHGYSDNSRKSNSGPVRVVRTSQ